MVPRDSAGDGSKTLDLIIAVLRDHEKEMDRLVYKLTLTKDRLLLDANALSIKLARIEKKVNELEKLVRSM